VNLASRQVRRSIAARTTALPASWVTSNPVGLARRVRKHLRDVETSNAKWSGCEPLKASCNVRPGRYGAGIRAAMNKYRGKPGVPSVAATSITASSADPAENSAADRRNATAGRPPHQRFARRLRTAVRFQPAQRGDRRLSEPRRNSATFWLKLPRSSSERRNSTALFFVLSLSDEPPLLAA